MLAGRSIIRRTHAIGYSGYSVRAADAAKGARIRFRRGTHSGAWHLRHKDLASRRPQSNIESPRLVTCARWGSLLSKAAILPRVTGQIRRALSSYLQFPSSFMFLVVRTELPPASLSTAVRNEVLAVDRDQPVSDVRTMDSAIRESTSQPRLSAELLGLFVLLAILLSAAGVYGVMSYTTSQRAAEIAIRMAVGARPRDILVMVLGEVGLLAGTAVLTGVIASACLTRTMKSLLFEVQPIDPAIF